MKHFTDASFGGHVMIFNGPLEMARSAADNGRYNTKNLGLDPTSNWNGRRFSSWEAFAQELGGPWVEGVKKVQDMLDELQQAKIPAPINRKRQRVWDDTTGDVNIDRIMRGESEFYEDVRRRQTHGPTNLALLCNLDAVCGDSAAKIFWRGAAAIAAADLLEAAGYGCEVWMWCRGYRVYPSPFPHQFTTCQLKGAGEAIDITALISGLSSWFLRIGVFGSFAASPTKPTNVGGANYELGDCRKYMEVTDGVLEVHMPVVETKQQAIDTAIRILNNMNDAQQGIE